MSPTETKCPHCGKIFSPYAYVVQTWRAGDPCPKCHSGQLVPPNTSGPGVINPSSKLLVCDRVGCGTSRLTTQSLEE